MYQMNAYDSILFSLAFPSFINLEAPDLNVKLRRASAALTSNLDAAEQHAAEQHAAGKRMVGGREGTRPVPGTRDKGRGRQDGTK